MVLLLIQAHLNICETFLSLSQVTLLRLLMEPNKDTVSIISIQILMRFFQELSKILILHTWVFGCTGLSHTSSNQTLVETKIEISIRTFLSSTVQPTSSQQLFHSSQNTLLVILMKFFQSPLKLITIIFMEHLVLKWHSKCKNS
jgi:hypothetical protein